MLAIRRLLSEHEPLDEGAIEGFLEQHRSPIVEGTAVTFVFHGDASDVRLRHFISGFPAKQPFRRIDGSDLWFLTMDVPPGSRVEYKLEVRRGRRRRLILDPLNPNIAHDPFGTNSVCYGSGYQRPAWTLPDEDARPGTLETVGVRSSARDEEVELRVYLPARLRRSRLYHLLIAFDGEDYLRYSDLQVVLDNLIHRYEIPPLIVALSQSQDRFVDYTASVEHARFVAEELLPGLEDRFPTRRTPDGRGLMGASLGAVASFWTAYRYPELFGNLLLQSGSFRFHDTGYEEHHPALGGVITFVNEFREKPVHVAANVAVTCGRYESLIWDNRALLPHLQAAGMRVQYREARDGHSWENWRNRLRTSLSWLFPGPLGLIYE